MQGVIHASTGGPMMVPPAPGLTVAVVQDGPRRYSHYKSRVSVRLGVTQIVLAVLSMIFTALAVLTFDSSGHIYIDTGFRCAILYIVAGAFGIAAKNKGHCMVVTHLVLSTIAAALTAIPFWFGLRNAIFRLKEQVDLTGMSLAIIAIVSFLEMITAVLAAVLSCKVVCRAASTQDPEVKEMSQYVVTMGPSNQLLLKPANQAPQPVEKDTMNIPLLTLCEEEEA